MQYTAHCSPFNRRAFCRVTFIEYYSKYLAKAASLLAANAPVSAMRLFDREHQNIHEVVRWASQNPFPEALPFYSDILWDSMPLLSGRLDLLQREVFCKVCVIRLASLCCSEKGCVRIAADQTCCCLLVYVPSHFT